MTSSASQLSIVHWDRTPLFLSEEERYCIYPWLYEVAEFRHHCGEKVLEIGCGTGCDLLQFARHGAEAVGVDITPEHIRLARERAGNLAKIYEADATELPFDNASFDYVYSHGVLHHLDQPRRMVEEIFRVLRPGGRFNVHVYARWSYCPPVLMLKHGRRWKLWIENSRDPVSTVLYSGRQLRQLFRPAQVSLEKREFRYAPALQRWLGWFLIAKGAV